MNAKQKFQDVITVLCEEAGATHVVEAVAVAGRLKVPSVLKLACACRDGAKRSRM